MPKYNYYCKSCDEYFEIRHSMKEVLDSCVCCESDTFSRIPSIPSYINKINVSSNDGRPGALVEEYIKKNRQSVKEEKERLKQQEYKS